MNEEQITRLFAEISEIKKVTFSTADHMGLVDKRLAVIEQKLSVLETKIGVVDSRLSLIEQRLSNIELWIPVDHRHLQHA